MSASRPTVGIIGLGYGRAHVPGFQARGCEVVAVSQRDEVAARKVAAQYGVPQVYARWEELIERARPQIVVVATPVHLHAPITERAFAAGAHVLCEKPLAMSAGEARVMIDGAARAKRVGMTAFNWRFTPAMQEFHRLVGEGVLGRVFHVRAWWYGARWADEAAAPTWRMDRAQAGFGALGDMGVHLVDLVRWSFGEWARVTAVSGVAYPQRSAPGLARPADAEDHCTVLGELASGPQVTLMVSRVAHGKNEHVVEAFGSAGALTYRYVREGAAWTNGEVWLARGGKAPERVTPRGPQPAVEGDMLEQIGRGTIAPLVDVLLDGIRTGQSPSPSFEDGLRAQVVLDAAVAAASRWAELPATTPARA